MKSLSLLLICFFISFTAFASEGTDYLTYHQNVSQAEQLISERKFEKALEMYGKTFEQFDFIFLRDYKIAAQLAFHTKDTALAYDYIRKGIQNGWTLKDIKKNQKLEALCNSPKWKALELQYDSLHLNYIRNINQPLREEIRQLYKKDQRMALRLMLGSLFRWSEKAQANYYERKFVPHDQEQIAQLEKIMQQYGYPGERLTGNDSWMSTILSHHNSISKEYCQQDTIYPDLKPRLIEEIRKGYLSPFEFALIDNWYFAVKSGHTEASYGFLGPTLTLESLEKVNDMRKQIGLRSIDTRNGLVAIQEETDMNFYLPGEPWQRGKIEVKEEWVKQ